MAKHRGSTIVEALDRQPPSPLSPPLTAPTTMTGGIRRAMDWREIWRAIRGDTMIIKAEVTCQHKSLDGLMPPLVRVALNWERA